MRPFDPFNNDFSVCFGKQSIKTTNSKALAFEAEDTALPDFTVFWSTQKLKTIEMRRQIVFSTISILILFGAQSAWSQQLDSIRATFLQALEEVMNSEEVEDLEAIQGFAPERKKYRLKRYDKFPGGKGFSYHVGEDKEGLGQLGGVFPETPAVIISERRFLNLLDLTVNYDRRISKWRALDNQQTLQLQKLEQIRIQMQQIDSVRQRQLGVYDESFQRLNAEFETMTDLVERSNRTALKIEKRLKTRAFIQYAAWAGLLAAVILHK